MGGDVALVFAGGDRPPDAVTARLPDDAVVIAADSGLDHAVALGFAIDLVVGDLDSVDPRLLASARAAGTTVETHPREKDETDLELALGAALARGARTVTVVGGAGGRLDHFLANLTVLASPRFRELRLDAWVGFAHVTVVRDDVVVEGRVGALVSLVPLGGRATGIRTEGLRYPLADEDLEAGTTRGVSNELLVPSARVRIRTGTLLVIAPEALEEP
ncbi:MAG TPA: thiamine diphosphokinase [Acidimicrobiia bacterium]|nr:thiamine diphosphokinase [Acidimicrobiia bacterium]